jgi:large subunit ribosomal protein L10
MASAKILENKKAIVEEIKSNIQNSESVIIFTYQGLTVSELGDLRKELKKTDSEVRVYKNTLFKRAVDDLGINLDGFLEGPNAILFGKDLLEPIKVISEFAKEHEKANITVGIIDGAPAYLDVIKEYASIPSRDGLLTMLAGGMIQYVKDLAIGLNMYAEQLEK